MAGPKRGGFWKEVTKRRVDNLHQMPQAGFRLRDLAELVGYDEASATVTSFCKQGYLKRVPTGIIFTPRGKSRVFKNYERSKKSQAAQDGLDVAGRVVRNMALMTCNWTEDEIKRVWPGDLGDHLFRKLQKYETTAPQLLKSRPIAFLNVVLELDLENLRVLGAYLDKMRK